MEIIGDFIIPNIPSKFGTHYFQLSSIKLTKRRGVTMGDNLVVFLSGSVKKGPEDKRDPVYFWSDDDIRYISETLNNGNVTILNPSDVSICSSKYFDRFIADIELVLQSDVILVDARTYKGIGIGAEMMLAKLKNIPVIAFADAESTYRKTKKKTDNSTYHWQHPFLSGLCDYVHDSLDDAVKHTNELISNKEVKFRNRSIQDVQEEVEMHFQSN